MENVPTHLCDYLQIVQQNDGTSARLIAPASCTAMVRVADDHRVHVHVRVEDPQHEVRPLVRIFLQICPKRRRAGCREFESLEFPKSSMLAMAGNELDGVPMQAIGGSLARDLYTVEEGRHGRGCG